jgi:hypothetical protein
MYIIEIKEEVKMKKLFSFIMVAFMIFFVSCDGGGGSSTSKNDIVDIPEDVNEEEAENPETEEPVTIDPEDPEEPEDPIVVDPEDPIVEYSVVYTFEGAEIQSDVEEDTIITIANNTFTKVITANDGTEMSLRFLHWVDENSNVHEVGDSTTITSDKTFTAVFDNSVLTIETTSGIVFYDKGSYSDGWRYIEASTTDYNSGATVPWWGASSKSSYIRPDGMDYQDYLSIGMGKANTLAIISASPSSYCAASLMNEDSDWYLPSVREFQEMSSVLLNAGVGNLDTNAEYWTSNEFQTQTACTMFFIMGSEGYTLDAEGRDVWNGRYKMRGIRYF